MSQSETNHNKTKKSNRLIDEKSPYLLQHAYNPVDWYPWGKEAFEKAEAEEKLIFLSIGYSTCHWCHVMERESFEDAEVAGALNEDFVSIKVDREERPDIDAVYMTACQIMTGQGGWPLTIIMTPEQKPIFAGTYFPKKTVFGRPGLLDVLASALKSWKEDRDNLLSGSDRITALLNQAAGHKTDGDEKDKNFEDAENDILDDSLIIKAKQLFSDSFDEKYGGFGRSPKFPSPHNLLFLMSCYEKDKNVNTLEMVETTLGQMYRGGIFDHIGGGFSRYSTDSIWLVPHFEKMLYDNALLAMAYTQAYRLTEEPIYQKAVYAILDYVIREMTDPEGGFYSAQDADSDGVEGKYYLFRPEEVLEILGEEKGRRFCRLYDITEEGNFEGGNIPNLLRNREYNNLPTEIEDQKNKLYAYRITRHTLHKDDKILTSWNGLMIAAFAGAYREFRDRRYLDAAESAYGFIETKLARKNGSLRVRYRDYEPMGRGFLDDYAFLIWGLLELYEATHRVRYLQDAMDFNQYMVEHFRDDEGGGFFLTDIDGEKLISRPKETYDGSMPSGNSVAAYNLVRLNRKMGNRETGEAANRQLKFIINEAKSYPMGHSFALLALSDYLK